MLHRFLQVGSVGLQITRSLGDFDQKAHGVVAHPEVTEYCLGAEDTGGCGPRAHMLLHEHHTCSTLTATVVSML